MAFLNIAPTGTVLPFAGSTAPEGWLICNGSSQSTTTYAKLFAVIGYTYGGTGGSFNVPDMRGVFPRGSGTNSTANYGGVTGHTPAGGSLASKGGQKTGKNGLSAASSSISLTMNSSSISALSLNNESANHSHGQNNTGTIGGGDFGVVDAPSYRNRIMVSQDPYSYYNISTGGQSASHSHSLSSGTAAAQSLSSGTATAQTISGDTETTPAFLALNYIIKL